MEQAMGAGESGNYLSEKGLTIAFKVLEVETPAFAQRVDDLIFAFGHVEINDPERQVLQQRVKEILTEWSCLVLDLGGHPRDLWSAAFYGPDGEVLWQYPCSRLHSYEASKWTTVQRT